MVESWIAPLAAGDPEAAWELFIERYRRLIFGAIRRYASDPDDVMDVFARVCEALRANDFKRLRNCAVRADPDRPLSTWLVVVVHNLTVDWIRHRDGRPRPRAAALSLPPLRRKIYEYVFVDGRSHVEAYELLRSREDATLSFGEFLKELRETVRAGMKGHAGGSRAPIVDATPLDAESGPREDAAVVAERERTVGDLLESLPSEDRLAVQLYVVDGMPAKQVAIALGLPGVKAVYNRVYRALAAMRARLERDGVRSGDL